ncbi:hypothetical protein [Taibaiella chishuiensis]|uniref:Uncharacterized protein n=1 Tax=Taibaiella chishuiensis TaxID=1434707 RepID=A0A2P8DDF7_9BACT|nr:hypothetical protein [Taibaiella chishuiensis]PSK95225.1 hypothetical protein B0I18_1011391 [Taibaiella chishuiensis]
MKKLLLAAVALAGACGFTHANSVTVRNLTGCTFTLDFSSIMMTMAPGETIVTSAPGAADLTVCKVIYNDGLPGRISIGAGIVPGYVSYANSLSSPNNPPCVTNGFYSVAWSQSSPTADAQLMIF